MVMEASVDGLEGMRSLLRGSLARSLERMGVGAEDRLAAAWTVACGRAMAEHGEIVGFADGVLEVLVADAAWLHQMVSMRGQLAAAMSRIAGVPVREIHFERRGAPARRMRRNVAPNSRSEGS